MKREPIDPDVPKDVIFMVEGGRALELVREHIAEKQRVRACVRMLCEELGVTQGTTDRDSGVLTGVNFRGEKHPQFKKPNRRGVSFPMKGTEWAKKFAAQIGTPHPVRVIAEHFSVPLSLSYSNADCTGWRCIGGMANECGWLYLSANGPYALWVPDVPAYVAEAEADGYEVAEPAKSFKMDLPGCRRIESEEWEILVAQDALDKKRQGVAA